MAIPELPFSEKGVTGGQMIPLGLHFIMDDVIPENDSLRRNVLTGVVTTFICLYLVFTEVSG